MRIDRRQQNESGLATLLVILLLVLMVSFITMNAMAIASLKREMKLVEKRQLMQAKAASTNAPPPSAP